MQLASAAMTSRLRETLTALSPELRARLDGHGFDERWFLAQAASLERPGRDDNRVAGVVEPPAPGDVSDLPDPDTPEAARLKELGERALRAGECALVVLAGGMATRMGGVVKALVEALPSKSFLDLRLAGQRALEQRYGTPIPLWLMTSAATDQAIRTALGGRLDGYHRAVFTQSVALRLDSDGDLFTDDDGRPSEYAPGHGDLPDALRRSGLLARFLDAGGKYLTTANIDNLGAALDPLILGWHIDRGHAVTCEVVAKAKGDRGGIPARLDGKLLILEEFRLPDDFDGDSVRVFNTNTFHFDVAALAALDIDWTYFVVRKEVEGRPVLQFERLVNEVTAHLDTGFLRVPREGPHSRFLPVKDESQLAARRPEIEAVAEFREMLG